MTKKKNNKSRKPRRQMGNPYEVAFRSMCTRCKKPVLLLLNETVGTTYDGSEELQFLPNESFLPDVDGSTGKHRKRVSDSQFEVIDHSGKKRRFQIECQSSGEKDMALRVLEYSLTFVRDHTEGDRVRIIARIQNVAILYLRTTASTPDTYAIELAAPNHKSISWKIPVIKATKYTLEDLLTRRLYFLLPFHIFAYEEQFGEMEKDVVRRLELIGILDSITQHVDELHCKGELSSEDTFSIMDNFSIVAASLTSQFKNLGKDVQSFIGKTRNLRTLSQLQFDKCRAKGRAEGLAEGKELGEFQTILDAINDGIASIEYLQTKKNWPEDKIKRFRLFQEKSLLTAAN